MEYTYAVVTSPGARVVNEDSIRVSKRSNGLAAFVADGLGGQGQGDLASSIAAETALSNMGGGSIFMASGMTRAFERANTDVFKERSNLGNSMMSTLCGVALWGSKVCMGHVGDSRIYWFRNDRILYQSKDHSVSQLMVETGEITQDMIRGHSSRNLLVKAMGESENVQPTVHCESIKSGDRFLLCTDGFWELVNEAEMIETAEDADVQNWLVRMDQLVRMRLTPQSDNYSAVAIVIK